MANDMANSSLNTRASHLYASDNPGRYVIAKGEFVYNMFQNI